LVLMLFEKFHAWLLSAKYYVVLKVLVLGTSWPTSMARAQGVHLEGADKFLRFWSM
jgi:hypothetical protein